MCASSLRRRVDDAAGQGNTVCGRREGAPRPDAESDGSDNIPGGIGCRSMRRTPFNDGWTVGPKANSFMEMIVGSGSEPELVTLPHDAMIRTERSAAGHA